MALGSDILRLVIDADSSGAVSEFKKLGKGIEDTGDKAATGFKGKLTQAFDGLQQKSSTVSGIFDKIGLSSSQAAGVISAAIPAAGVAAAAGLVAFAAKGIAAFQETALAAGKFADSTGLSVDAASRYIAVADDIGVGADTVQSAFLKMEKAMGANKSAFADLIVTTKAGGTDLSATFLNAITHLQGIKDPIERATESSKLFGKGFSQVSELIGMDADKLKASLAGVSDAQVISADELGKARDYRAAMDNLNDAVRDLSIKLGENLVPTLTAAADALAKLIGWWEVAANFDKNGGIFGALTGFKVDFQAKSWGDFIHKVDDGKGSLDQAGLGLAELKAQIDAAATGADGGVPKFERSGAAMVTVGMSASAAARLSAESFGTFEARLAGTSAEIDRNTAALKRQNDAISANANAQLAAFDATFAVTQAQNDFAKAHMESTVAINEGKVSIGELQTILDAETQSAEKSALAIQHKAENDAIASGTALTAAQSNDVLITALEGMASQASGPSKTALQQLIDKLKETGQQKPEPTVGLKDNASAPLRGVKDGLDGVRGTYTATVDVNTSSANAKLNALANRLSAAARTGVQILGGSGGVAFAEGGMVPGAKGQPLAATVHGGEFVLPAGLVDAIKQGRPPSPFAGGMAGVSGASSGNTVNVYFSGLVTDEFSVGKEIKRVLAKTGYSGVS